MSYQSGFTHSMFLDYLYQLKNEPDAREEIFKVLFGAIDSFEPGVILSEPVTRWLGETTLLGAMTPASYLAWMGEKEETPMRWVVRSALSTVLAAPMIETFREAPEFRCEGTMNHLGNRLRKLLPESEDGGFESTLEAVTILVEEKCLTNLDALEILDGVFHGRSQAKLIIQTLLGILRVSRFYVIGGGRDWYVTPGTVKAMDFEIRARLVLMLLKEMILADGVVDPNELTIFYRIAATKYSIPPDQAKWLFDEIPPQFNMQEVISDMCKLLSLEKRQEVFQSLKDMAMADEVLDDSEKDMLDRVESLLGLGSEK